MSIVPISLPEKDVNGHISKWQAVQLPIIYQVQRQDQQVQMKYKPTGFNVIVKVNGTVLPEAAIGDNIRYFSPTGETYLWTITGINGSNIETDGTITGVEYGGFINYVDSRINYFIETEIYGVDNSNTYVLVGTLEHVPNLIDVIKVSINQWLKTLAVYQNDFNYDQINKAMFGEGGKYQIRFKEVYDGSVDFPQTVTTLHYWTNSNKQIQEIYGSNMGDFVPTLDDTRENRAKFMSVFEKPTYFPGYPFSLNFIYSDNLLNKQITREERELDLNGVEVTTSSTDLLINERFFNNRLMLKEGYPSTAKTIEVWLESGADVDEPKLEEGDYGDGTIFQPWLQTSSPVKPAKPTK